MTIVEQWNAWRKQISKDIILFQHPIDLSWAEEIDLRWENLWFNSLSKREQFNCLWDVYILQVYSRVLEWYKTSYLVDEELSWEYEMMSHGEGYNYEKYKMLGEEIQQHYNQVELNFRNFLLELENSYEHQRI